MMPSDAGQLGGLQWISSMIPSHACVLLSWICEPFLSWFIVTMQTLIMGIDRKLLSLCVLLFYVFLGLKILYFWILLGSSRHFHRLL